MKDTKRFYTKIIQSRQYAVKPSGVGKEWIPRIEQKYEFANVGEFLRAFPPTKESESLVSAINKAYTNCGKCEFNAGDGNEVFTFFA